MYTRLHQNGGKKTQNKNPNNKKLETRKGLRWSAGFILNTMQKYAFHQKQIDNIINNSVHFEGISLVRS